MALIKENVTRQHNTVYTELSIALEHLIAANIALGHSSEIETAIGHVKLAIEIERVNFQKKIELCNQEEK